MVLSWLSRNLMALKNKTMLFLFYNKSMLALNKKRVVNVKNGMVIDKFETFFFPPLGPFLKLKSAAHLPFDALKGGKRSITNFLVCPRATFLDIKSLHILRNSSRNEICAL